MRTITRLSFDRFEVDLQRRRLTKGGRTIRLQPQPFTLLAALIIRAGETVTREELRQTLWAADTHVAFETGLNTAMRKLRRALGDSADEARFVQTVPGIGYRFIAAVAEMPVTASAVGPTPRSVMPASPVVSTFSAFRLCARFAILLILVVTTPARPPEPWRAQADLGHRHFAADDRSGAVAAFARAVASGADDEAVFVEYACALAYLRQPARALAVIEQGLARLPKSAALRANRGLYLHAVGRYDEELAALADAVALDARSAEAQFHLGLGFARRQEYSASLSALQRAVDLSDSEPHYLSWLGRIAADAGRRDQAESVLRTLQQHAATRAVPEDLINAVVYQLGRRIAKLARCSGAHRRCCRRSSPSAAPLG